MNLALIRGSDKARTHIVTQPGKEGPFGPVETWTLCGRRIHHGPRTEIMGPINSDGSLIWQGLCRKCEYSLELIQMAERYERERYGAKIAVKGK